MTAFEIIETTPEHVRVEIRAAYQHDSKNWHRRPTLRLWKQAMRRAFESRGFYSNEKTMISLVEGTLHLSQIGVS